MMNKNIFKYHLKMIFNDKITVFWLLVYPILLATLFNFAFSNINYSKGIEKINISVVEDMKDTEIIKIIEEVNVFNIKSQNFDDAMQSLKSKETEFAVYISEGNDIEFYTLSNGLNQIICKSIFDSYYQVQSAIKNIVSQKQDVDIGKLIEKLSVSKNYTTDNEENKSGNLSFVYFYTILSMLSLMCGTLGVEVVNCMQANQSDVAQRICLSPINKWKALVSYISAAMCFQILSILLTLFYLNVVLKIDFEGHFFLVILICFIGSILGISFGTFISSIIKNKYGIKIMIVIVVSLLSCFLSGMMMIDMKYIIQSKLPLLAKINPATLITDGIYSLYYYDTLSRFIENISVLSIEAIAFVILSYIVLRRQRYENI